MNKAIRNLFILLFIDLIYISCDKKVANPAAPPTIPAPEVGFDNGGNIEDTNSESSTFGGYSITYTDNLIRIYASYDPYDSPHGSPAINIKFYAKTIGTYILSNKDSCTFIYSNNLHYVEYYTDSVHTGKVILTQLDTVNHLASGTFWFACEMQYPNVNGGIDTLTNGYFTNLKW